MYFTVGTLVAPAIITVLNCLDAIHSHRHFVKMADVKAEMQPSIKVDPAEDTKDARDMADVDEFDDDTDLHIPPDNTQAWLVKLPKELWQAWHGLYDSAPDEQLIEVGKMRVYHQAPDADVMQQKIQIRLHDAHPQHTDLPRNYDLHLTSNGYGNTVVFAEKDLPGHRKRQPRPGNLPAPGGIPTKTDRYNRPTYRTAIPKHTALAPMLHHEATATPIQDDAYFAHMKRQWDAHTAPKSRTTYLAGVDAAMHPGLASNLDTAFGLSQRTGKLGGRRKKVVQEKAVRMGQADLIDALYHCFRRFKYWSLKALRNELRQPEVWIKENLETIATLVRSGDFAMTWVLRPEYQGVVVREGDEVKEEVAKVESGAEDGGGTGDEMGGDEEEFDDGGDEFEDVKMEGS